MNGLIYIGQPGKFDPIFALFKQHRKSGQVPRYVYLIVWKASALKVKRTPGFYDPLKAERFVKKNRIKLIDELFEQIVLVNK